MSVMKTVSKNKSSSLILLSVLLLSSLGLLALSAPSRAAEPSSIFSSVPGEIRLEKVPLAKSLTIDVDGKKESLKRVAAGIRKKQIAILWPKVYVGQVFMNDDAVFQKSTIAAAFDSIEKASVAAMSMTFLRDVDNAKLLAGFTDSLAENRFFPDKDPVAKELLDMVKKSGDIKEGQTIWIGLKKNGDANQTLLFVNGEGFLQKALVGIGASRRIFSMWFGRAADSGIKDLQEQLLAADKSGVAEKRNW